MNILEITSAPKLSSPVHQENEAGSAGSDLLAQGLAQLTELERKVMAFLYHEGLRIAEVAAVFGIPELRAGQLHDSALAKLRATAA